MMGMRDEEQVHPRQRANAERGRYEALRPTVVSPNRPTPTRVLKSVGQNGGPLEVDEKGVCPIQVSVMPRSPARGFGRSATRIAWCPSRLRLPRPARGEVVPPDAQRAHVRAKPPDRRLRPYGTWDSGQRSGTSAISRSCAASGRTSCRLAADQETGASILTYRLHLPRSLAVTRQAQVPTPGLRRFNPVQYCLV